MKRMLATSVVVLTAGCSVGLQPSSPVVQARFDPQAQVVPMPNDILRDATTGLLALPIDDSLDDAEKELRTWMNTLDGWPTTLDATVEFSAPVDAATVDDDSVQVWRWGDAPMLLGSDVAPRALDHAATTLTITPPQSGWDRGATYVILARGGAEGLRGAAREPVIADAAFYFLRLKQPLDDPAHERAFPGDTRDERMANAQKLEAIRRQLVPYLDFFEARGIPRSEVASLWVFTPTTRTELAMDASSQRMPLPFDLLIDRSTMRIAIPPHAGDLPVEAEGKQRLAEYDGWGLSAGIMLETTAPLSSTIDPTAFALYDTMDPAHPLPVTVKLHSDRQHVEVTPKTLPLAEAHTYGLVVRDSFVDAGNRAVEPMTIGHFMRAAGAISDGMHSRVAEVSDDDAARVEWTRQRISGLFDVVGRDHVVTAIPFTTQTVVAREQKVIDTAAALGPPATPQNIKHQTPLEAVAAFPLGITALANVADVYIGTLSLPSWLDDVTLSWHSDGTYKRRDVEFTLTVPSGASGPVPVVIFGHGLVTSGRFVLALAQMLAARGFASISIDFPYHGQQARCMGDGGVIEVVDPQTGKQTALPQCNSGSTCNQLGHCIDANGKDTGLAMFPVINTPVASGAAFIQLDHIANTKDHFQQALVDLSELKRSLQHADWSFSSVKLDGSKLFYTGQSLGGIMGGLFVPYAPEIGRAVLNVPGCGLVDMYKNSTFFASQVNGFFTRNNIDPQSWQAARFLNLARLFQDAIDPESIAYKLAHRSVFIQMATLDFIIPNANTEELQTLSGAPRRDYVAEHGFIVIPAEPACEPAQADLGDFLTGALKP